MAIAEKGEMQDRLGVGLALLNDRLLDFVGKPSAHAPNAIAHVSRRVVGIAAELEAYRDLARFLPADRSDEVDALDAGERVFQHFGDLRFDDCGARPWIARLHGDDRRIDCGIFTHAQAVIGDKADQHENQAQDRGEDRPLDRKFRKRHNSGPDGVDVDTGVPSRILS